MKALRRARHPYARPAYRDSGRTDLDRVLWSHDFARAQTIACWLILGIVALYFTVSIAHSLISEAVR